MITSLSVPPTTVDLQANPIWERQPRRPAARSTTAASSAINPAAEDDRLRLLVAIASLGAYPVTWGEREPVGIDDLAIETALAFISRLPADRAFPKVAPDGEGGLMLIWDGEPPRALLSIDRTMLSLILNPGTPASDHLPSARFDGELIPAGILNVLPHRR